MLTVGGVTVVKLSGIELSHADQLDAPNQTLNTSGLNNDVKMDEKTSTARPRAPDRADASREASGRDGGRDGSSLFGLALGLADAVPCGATPLTPRRRPRGRGKKPYIPPHSVRAHT